MENIVRLPVDEDLGRPVSQSDVLLLYKAGYGLHLGARCYADLTEPARRYLRTRRNPPVRGR